MSKKKKKVIAIVQARMSSSRLPGKVLMKIEEKAMLWHVVNRLKYSRLIEKIVVATSTSRKDDLIKDFCQKEKIDFYRGSEGDVLDRYYQVAKLYKAEVIVRITADCPLIEPRIVDMVIAVYLRNINNFDGTSNIIKRTYPRGLDTEVISFYVLKECWRKAKKEHQREHVTPYIYKHSELFKLYSIENKVDLSSLRWTVDEKKDLKFVREIYKRLYQEKKVFLMKDILKVLNKEPDLEKINKNVKQKVIIK